MPEEPVLARTAVEEVPSVQRFGKRRPVALQHVIASCTQQHIGARLATENVGAAALRRCPPSIS